MFCKIFIFICNLLATRFPFTPEDEYVLKRGVAANASIEKSTDGHFYISAYEPKENIEDDMRKKYLKEKFEREEKIKNKYYNTRTPSNQIDSNCGVGSFDESYPSEYEQKMHLRNQRIGPYGANLFNYPPQLPHSYASNSQPYRPQVRYSMNDPNISQNYGANSSSSNYLKNTYNPMDSTFNNTSLFENHYSRELFDSRNHDVHSGSSPNDNLNSSRNPMSHNPSQFGYYPNN